MLNLPVNLAAHFGESTQTLAFCWRVVKNNGDIVRGTSHDRDVVITVGEHAGTYYASSSISGSATESKSDGSVTNVEVSGFFWIDDPSITVEDIEGGLFDQAEAWLLLLNWAEPDDGQRVMLRGTVGNFTRDSSGMYRSEVRGMTQAYSQQVVRTASVMCDVKLFGDARCKFDVDAVTRTGTVTAVESRKRFDATLDAGPAPLSDVYYYHGRLLWTSGANTDYVREVRVANVGTPTELLLWDETPADIEVGDTFELPPGCDRQYETCRLIHDNLVNFRGWGLYSSGIDALMRGPKDPSVVEGESVWTTLTEDELQAVLAAQAAASILLL